jgi:beta-barrel assembly-enhancing protease
MKKLFFWAFLLCPILMFAQDFNHYRLSKNAGPIPATFTSSSTEKYRSEIIRMEKELSARERKNQKQFYLETNFVIDDLLLSGKVLFGSELNRYLEKVAAKVLEQVPELKDKVQFYILRSSAVNAFATQQGIIFINMGLLAQLENEAQLAFIIAHELSHVKRSHVLNAFLEKKNIDKKISREQLMRQTDFDETLVTKNRYSRELEFEADNDGLDMYLKTKYSLSEIDGVFDVLKYAHLLFDTEDFDKNFFNIGTIVLPPHCFLDSTKSIKPLDDSNDERSTHPSTSKRLEKIKSAISQKENSGRQPYLVSKEDFLKIRKIARFELVYYYLHYFRYEDAIYTAYLLLKEHPESEFLHKSISQALYGMSKHYNAEAKEEKDSDYQRSRESYKEIEGPQQQVYYLCSNLKNKEVNVIALRFAWQTHQKFPNNKDVEQILKDLFTELAFHYEDLSGFKKLSKEEVYKALNESLADTSNYTKVNRTELETKFEVKNQEQIKNKNISNFDLAAHAFGDIVDTDHFKQHFESGKKEHDRIDKIRKYYQSKEGQKAWSKEIRKRQKKGYKLGIDSVIVLNPFYLELDARRDNAYRYINTEKGQSELREIMADNAKKAGIHAIMLDAEGLKTENTELANEISTLNDWLSEISRSGTGFNGFSQQEVDEIVKKYGTPYILKTGVVSLRKQKSIILAAIAITYAVAIVPIPLSIYLLAKPEYECLFFSVIYDTRDGSYTVLRYNVFNRKGSKGVLNSFVYDSFYQIKSKNR